MSLLNHVHKEIKSIFEKHPYRFFTEHDIHSELARIATEYLVGDGSLYAKTIEGYEVSRVHHEYPTPFRCDMRNYDFRVITEDEFDASRQKGLKTRARRGFIDLVVLNPDFCASNKLSVVTGKMYADVLASLRDQQYPALDLAIEVVYHSTYDRKKHAGIMKRRVTSTKQDYDKLVALKNLKYTGNRLFCKEAAMFFFSNTTHEDELDELFDFSLEQSVPCFRIVHSIKH